MKNQLFSKNKNKQPLAVMQSIKCRANGLTITAILLTALVLVLGYAEDSSLARSSGEDSNEGWEIEVAEDHGHSHGDDHGHTHGEEGEKTVQVTVWGERFEIFLEHPYIVAGDPTPFVTHVTDLEKLVPRTVGPIEFVLRLVSETPIRQVSEAPVRDGIYIPELTFPKAGTWDVSIVIPIDGKDSTVELPPTEVYATSHDVEHAPDPEEIEGITFLKEQQWKFPFRTEVLQVKDGSLSVPESAVVYGKEGPFAYVHVAGETVQQRMLEIGDPKNGSLEIISGLKEGDRVVVRGADAIVISSASDEDHGHDHGEGDHGHDHGQGGHDHSDADHDANAIHLSEEMRSSLGLTTATVRECDLVKSLDVYGWVRPRQESMTEVRSPVTGIIKELSATQGQVLKEGDPIVTLQAREILSWQQTILDERNRRKKLEDTKGLLEAEGRAKMAELVGGLRVDAAEVSRISNELTLIEKAGAGAVAQREVNKIRGELQSAMASLNAKETLAQAYGLSTNQITSLKTSQTNFQPEGADLPPEYQRQLREIEFNLQSSITEENVAIANLKALDFDHEHLDRLTGGDASAIVDTIVVRAKDPFFVTDLQAKRQASLNLGDPILAGIDYSNVLIDAEIPEVEIAMVLNRSGDVFPVRIPALNHRTFEAEVLYFDTTVHAGDRKAHLVLTLKNTDDLALRDGMAVSVGIPIEVRHGILAVPKEAVLSDGMEKVVFLAEEDHYHRQAVSTGIEGFEATEILGGLSSGEEVVVSGAPALLLGLKSQEGSLTAGHGHPHPHPH